MALWMLRGGRYGEHEAQFFSEGRVYLSWEELETDLSTAADYADIKRIVVSTYPEEPERRRGNWAGQIWAFAVAMKPGDIVIVPRKTAPAVAIGEITGPYAFDE